MEVKFIQDIVVNDPDFGNPVTLHLYKEDGGLMFATESIFDSVDDKIISPYGNGELNIRE
jgi:hypothetical protein